MRKTFLIPEANEERFLLHIKRLNKINQKLTGQPFHCEKIGEEKRKVEDAYLVYFTYEVEGEAPMLNGYRLVAYLERQTELNLVNHLDREVALPKGLEERANYCEHCNSNRPRKHLFLLQEEETGKLIQVGKTCVKDFTGAHASPEAVADWYTFYPEIDDIEIVGPMNTLSAYRHHDTEKIVALSAYFTEKYGYVKAAEGTKDDPSTAKRVKEAINNKELFEEVRSNGYVEKAKETISWVLAMENVDYGYFRDLQTLLTENAVHPQKIGIVASAYHVHQKTVARVKEDKAKQEAEQVDKSQSNYVGTIGERKEYELIFETGYEFEGEFGMVYIYRFRDAEGNVFVWKTGKGFEFEKQESVVLKGTLKDHNEFRDEKQNILTRCKMA